MTKQQSATEYYKRNSKTFHNIDIFV